MTVTWRRCAILACVSLWLGTGGAGAALAADEPANVPRGRAEDPDYAAGSTAIKAEQFAAAIPLLARATARDPRNADAHNLLAYATRRNGDPAGAIPIYQKALAIDPKHRRAHEYIGEAYLMLGNVAKAREAPGPARQAVHVLLLRVSRSQEGDRDLREDGQGVGHDLVRRPR